MVCLNSPSCGGTFITSIYLVFNLSHFQVKQKMQNYEIPISGGTSRNCYCLSHISGTYIAFDGVSWMLNPKITIYLFIYFARTLQVSNAAQIRSSKQGSLSWAACCVHEKALADDVEVGLWRVPAFAEHHPPAV